MKAVEYAVSFLASIWWGSASLSLAKIKLGAQSFNGIEWQKALIWGCNQVDVCCKRGGKPNHAGNGGRALFAQIPPSVGWESKLPVVAVGNYFI